MLASTDRQATFLWQVSGPKFSCPKFLEDGVDNYYKFLSLRKHAPSQVIVPTYQIDLMWHTHILSSLSGYYKDCRAIMDSALHHDDSLNDRTDGGPLDVAFGQTKALWKEHYGTEYSVVGGMYRGEPPGEYYNRDWGLYNRKNDIELAPVGRFLHLVGIHGASSTNPSGGVHSTDEWTPTTGVAPDGSPGFVPPSAKSTTRGVNANPMKENYVFGTGDRGTGYYHVTTKDAYSILLKRIQHRVVLTSNQIACDQSCNNVFTCGMGGVSDSMQKRLDALEDLKETRDVIAARAASQTPSGDAPKSLSKKKHREYYSDSGVWYVPATCYVDGGGKW